MRVYRISSVKLLDKLSTTLEYQPLRTAVMRWVTELCATIRLPGLPTAVNAARDGGIILAAQTLMLADPYAIIATGHPGRLNRLTLAVGRQTTVP